MYKKYSTSEYIKKCIDKYQDKYEYQQTVYTGIYEPVIITCPKHGDFTVIARNFLRGTECQACLGKFNKSIFDKTKLFISKSEEIHNKKYDYSLSKYTLSKNHVKIICPEHGVFNQIAQVHLLGRGCPQCGIKKQGITFSLNFEKPLSLKEGWLKWCNKEATLYIIKCFNKNESFIKIGITKHKNVDNRFNYKKALPYNYEVIYHMRNDSNKIYDLECFLLKETRNSVYYPKLYFKGSKECRTPKCLDQILDKIENYEALCK